MTWRVSRQESGMTGRQETCKYRQQSLYSDKRVRLGREASGAKRRGLQVDEGKGYQ